MTQIKNCFDNETNKKILKGAGIAVGAAFLTYLTEHLGEFDFGNYTPIIVALLSILINAIREFQKGN